MTLVSQSSDPTYEATTGEVTRDERSHTVTAIFDEYETDRVDGTIIQREDRMILVKPKSGVSPRIGDTIQDVDGVVYNIMDVNAIKSYDQVFLWELQARK